MYANITFTDGKPYRVQKNITYKMIFGTLEITVVLSVSMFDDDDVDDDDGDDDDDDDDDDVCRHVKGFCLESP